VRPPVGLSAQAASKVLGTTPHAFLAQVSTNERQAALHTLLWPGIPLFALVAVLFGVAAWLVTRWTTRPVTVATARIPGLDAGAGGRIRLEGPDDAIKELADARAPLFRGATGTVAPGAANVPTLARSRGGAPGSHRRHPHSAGEKPTPPPPALASSADEFPAWAGPLGGHK
jgi:hypothetical protein